MSSERVSLQSDIVQSITLESTLSYVEFRTQTGTGPGTILRTQDGTVLQTLDGTVLRVAE